MAEVSIPKPNYGGCSCSEQPCYHTDPARTEERRRNARKGGRTGQYNRRSKESARYKRMLEAFIAQTASGELKPEQMTAINGRFAQLRGLRQQDAEDWFHYVLEERLMAVENRDIDRPV